MTRKYRSKGYMDDDRNDRPRPKRAEGDRPAPGRVETRFKRTIRCVECSATVHFIDSLKFTDTCQNCNADLYTCRNCKFFDPGAPNECMQPVPQRVEGKNVRNTCPLFKPKVLVEKAVESRRDPGTDNARKAFDDLFR